MFVPTLEIMTLMKAKLAAMLLAPETALFERVEIYGSENLTQAFEDLLVFEDRACLIIPAGDTHQVRRIGALTQARRTSEFVLLFADRVYGDREAAGLIGSPENPGTIGLKDRVLEELTGSQLDHPKLCLEPGSGDPFRISTAERDDLPGREAWSQTFTTPAGQMKVPLQQLTNQRSEPTDN